MVVKKFLFSPKAGYIYVRIRGVYSRITAAEGTPEFDQQYWEILRGKPKISRTSWSALIASYRLSNRWTNLAVRTRSDYERVLIYIQEKNGSKDVTRLRRSDVIAAQNINSHRVRFANYVPQVMSILCEHARDLGWLSENPAKGVRKIKTPDEKLQPHLPWSDEAVQHFRSESTGIPRLIFELGVGSVQRPGDLIGFRWSDYDGDYLLLRQNKTGVRLKLPCTHALRTALNAVTEKKGLTILTDLTGRPLTYRRMAEIMREERSRLGLLAHDLHALRYRGVMELAWAGCTDEEIAAYSGHSSTEMIRKYAGEARQITRALQAREKRP